MILRRLAYGFSSVALSLSSLFVLVSPVAHAANVAWDGEGADNNFSTAANWAGDVVPVDGDVLSFIATGMSADEILNNDLTNFNLGGITITGSSSWSYIISGNPFTLSGGINSSVNLSIATDITLGADVGIGGYSVAFGDALVSKTLNLNSHILTISTYMTLNSQTIGTGYLNVSPNSELHLQKANTFTGNIALDGSMGSKVYVYDASGLGDMNNIVTVNGDYAGVIFCGLNGATVNNNFTLNNATTAALSSVGSCGMGAALTESNPVANVTLAGTVTLQANSLVGSDGVLTITGPLLGAYTLTLESGRLGSLAINSSNNQSQTPNSTTQSSVKVTEVTDKQSSTSASVSTNEILVIKDTGERGAITLSGGTLKGTGTVGAVSMSLGKVAPGLSPGILNTGNLSFSGGTLEIEIGGATAGNGDGFHDQTNVTGTVDLGSNVTTLTTTLWNSFAPTVGQSYTIINNDSNDAVTGTFVGMADDSSFTQNGVTYTINYNGGDGNDVVLTVTAVPATVTAPNTGFAQLSNNPLLTLVSTLGIVVAIGIIARKQLKSTK